MFTLYKIKIMFFICYIYCTCKSITRKNTDNAFDYVFLGLAFMILALFMEEVK